ncbi:hypothetical protein M8J75_009232 [Diaphorina citri]|nr:hypothetical protein M8J75_009232 [Diaphorina citri]
MSNDGTRHVSIITNSSNIRQESVEYQVSHEIDKTLTNGQSQKDDRNNSRAKRSSDRTDDWIPATKEEPTQDTPATPGEAVSNLKTAQICFTSTEELHEKFPIYSTNLLNVWRSNNERTSKPPCQQNVCNTNTGEGKVLNQNREKLVEHVQNFNYAEGLNQFGNQEIVKNKSASSDYLDSKVLNDNLKLLRAKHEESQINKQFDCSNTLLHIRKLYDDVSIQNEGTGKLQNEFEAPSSASQIKSIPSTSFKQSFTNLIRGCSYFENKRLIPSAFRKTDLKACNINQPGALNDESEPDSNPYDTTATVNTSSDGNGSLQTCEQTLVQIVNISCKYATADNQNPVHRNQYVDELKISTEHEQRSNSHPNTEIEQNSEQNLSKDGSRSLHVTNDISTNSESWNRNTESNNLGKNYTTRGTLPQNIHTFATKEDIHAAKSDLVADKNLKYRTSSPNDCNSNEDIGDVANISTDTLDRTRFLNDTLESESDANVGYLTADSDDAFNITQEELLESLQLSQTTDELHESLGDKPDCLFHLTNDGTLGCHNIRLRVMLPALNKVLCSNRVSQMTRTYHDIEAVTRLLEEKEKDLELTARIGKELLATNQKLENTVAALDNELRAANENITQLNYELSQKNELITILTNDAQGSEDETDLPNTSGQPGSMQYEVLQRKIGFLERENRSLREETDNLCAATDQVEAAEQRLMQDLASQLNYAQSEVGMIEEDLNRTRSELSALKTQNQALVEKLTSTEDKLAQVTQNNTEMSLVVQLARETQCELAQELAEMKEKYAEVLSILAETQELLKRTKKRSMPGSSFSFTSTGSIQGVPSNLGPPHPDSLAAELECSLFSEFSLDSGLGTERGVPRYKRVFDTVRCSSLSSGAVTPHTTPSLYYESLGSSITTPSQTSHPLSYPGECPKGIPGIPGSADLEAALRRLTPGAVLARRTQLSSGLTHHDFPDCPRTPDSVLSTGSAYSAGGVSSSGIHLHHGQWKVPEKLQIVKPLEGSATLQHWTELATPSLSNILDERPGVKVRGSAMDLPPRTYTLDDVEEDDEIHPGKQFQSSIHTYTFTNSTVKHPDDYTSVTPSMRSSRMCTEVNSRCSSLAPSRRNSIGGPSGLYAGPSGMGGPSYASPSSHCSVSLSLAKVLHEKGIQAATPSTLVTPNYTPTATPCNSPERSRDSSPTREVASSSPSTSSSSMYSPFGLPGYLVASGAELLRRALVGPMTREGGRRRAPLPPPEAATGTGRALVGSNKALTNMSIVEQLEKIGLDNLVGGTPAPSVSPNGTPTRTRTGTDQSRRVRADLGTVPFKGPSIGTMGSMRKGGLL